MIFKQKSRSGAGFLIGGGYRIRTYKGLLPPVFKTGALAVLPTLQFHYNTTFISLWQSPGLLSY